MAEFFVTHQETLLRFVRFLVVGGGSAVVQLLVLRALKSRMNETLAFSISWVISTTTHYLANRFWALPSGRGDTGQQFAEYLFTVALSYVVNLGAFKLLREKFKMSAMWATAWAIPPSTIVVYLLLEYRVFAR